MRTALALLCCCWLVVAEAASVFDEAGELAEDARHGAERIGDGIRGILRRDEQRVVASTAASQADEAMTTTPQPRTVIGSAKRCAPSEVFAAGECRPTD